MATKRYESKAKETNYWLDSMESKLDKLDLTVQEAKAVDLQIQQLRVRIPTECCQWIRALWLGLFKDIKSLDSLISLTLT